MRVETDGFAFDFSDALDAFVFDEKDTTKPTYHGQPMKAVDLIAEFDNKYVFVEIKDFENPNRYNVKERGISRTESNSNRLKKSLKYKYRDSYLFRHAEHKVEKPIHYICLLTFDNALNTRMQKALCLELPVGKASKRWKQEIVESCQVVNIEQWNENFEKWPVRKIPTGVA